MPEKTVSWVSPIGSEPDRFDNYYINVAFTDETVGYIGGKAETAERHWTALTETIGKPTEFQLEDKGFSSKGKPKFKIVSYGGAGTVLSPAPTSPARAEMEEFIQERMDRRTALMQSVAIGSGITTELAEKFYRWLRAPLEDVSAPGGAGTELAEDASGSRPKLPAGTRSAGRADPVGADTTSATVDGEAAGAEAGSEEVVQPRAASSDPPRKLGWDNREDK